MPSITFLGTCAALALRRYNTCFVLDTTYGRMLVDTGGGNMLIKQLQLTGFLPHNIDALFLTHAHTDHILGAPWMLRFIAIAMRKRQIDRFGVYANHHTMEALKAILGYTLNETDLRTITDGVDFVLLGEDSPTMVDRFNTQFTFFPPTSGVVIVNTGLPRDFPTK